MNYYYDYKYCWYQYEYVALQVKDRQKAYKCDVVYLTNAELGFDYLRDNLAVYPHQVGLTLHVDRMP